MIKIKVCIECQQIVLMLHQKTIKCQSTKIITTKKNREQKMQSGEEYVNESRRIYIKRHIITKHVFGKIIGQNKIIYMNDFDINIY